jgi:hypothetical protein
MSPFSMALVLGAEHRAMLERLLLRSMLGQVLARLVRVTPAMAAKAIYAAIGAPEQCTDRFITTSKRQYVKGSVLAMGGTPQSDGQRLIIAALEARVGLAHRADGTARPTHALDEPSTDREGRRQSLYRRRVREAPRLKPHRLDRYNASPPSDFESRVSDNFGVYVAPPTNSLVFFVDEKPAVQVLDRANPVLPL